MTHKQAKLKRIRLGLKQSSVAERIGVSKSSLSQYENYGCPLPREAQRKLNRILAARRKR